MSDFPFGIEDVARTLGFSVKGKSQVKSEYINCPFCGKKKKLNLNYSKDQFRCPACNVGGSMLKLYSLCSGFEGTNGEIVAKIKEDLGIDSYNSKHFHSTSQPPVQESLNVDFQEMEHWDKVYRALLGKLGLGDIHYKRLRSERHMSDEEISRYMFKSVPLLSYTRICSELIAEGYDLEGVGGFYYDEEAKSWNIAMNPKITGYIIPVWNFFGKIQGLQVRLDKPFGSYKYHLISSDDYPKGTKTTAVPFFVKGEHPRKAQTLVVTEGFFKAAISNQIFGCDVMALFGVNNQKEFERLIPYIKKRGYTKIVEAFDADYVKNENVANAKKAFAKICVENGFELQEFSWDISKGKGLDDFALWSLSNPK